MGSHRGGCLVLLALAACGGPRRAPLPPVPGTPDAFASPYFPAGHPGQMFTDWAALRECGLFDFLERMPMFEGQLDALSRPFGCDPDQLDRVRTAVVFEPSGSRSAHMHMISVAETAPGASARQPHKSWVAVAIGGHACFRENIKSPQEAASFWPQPGLAVSGDHQMLAQLLEGKVQGGGPHPELQPLLPGDRVLFQYAFGRFGQEISQLTGTFGWYFPFDQDDPVDFVRLRLCLDQEGGLVVSLRFRFAKGTSGLRATEQWVRDGLVELAAKPQLASSRELLGAIVVQTQERDFDMSMALGKPRQAMGKIERAVIALMSGR